MEEAKEIEIGYGGMSDSFKDQLTKQDVSFDEGKIAHFQSDFDAMLRLRIRGFIADRAYDKMIQKLHKNIFKHLENYE